MELRLLIIVINFNNQKSVNYYGLTFVITRWKSRIQLLVVIFRKLKHNRVTIAELSTLKQVRFFWPTLYKQKRQQDDVSG